MNIRATRRELAIEAMADYLLIHGLEAATLRQLAEAAGTSDRMLLYYFNNRDELLSATLERIAARLATKLDAVVPPGERRPFALLLAEVRTALGSGELRPYMDIWLSLSARARSNPMPDMAIAGAIADRFLAWTTDRISAANRDACAEQAALLITVLNGLHVLQAIGRAGIADVALSKLATFDNPIASAT